MLNKKTINISYNLIITDTAGVPHNPMLLEHPQDEENDQEVADAPVKDEDDSLSPGGELDVCHEFRKTLRDVVVVEVEVRRVEQLEFRRQRHFRRFGDGRWAGDVHGAVDEVFFELSGDDHDVFPRSKGGLGVDEGQKQTQK
uniref:Uncharacterized protein n=1 Tax=Lygus hesperus TaxID=30085 RepID=A0A146MDP1_LYGHE